MARDVIVFVALDSNIPEYRTFLSPLATQTAAAFISVCQLSPWHRGTLDDTFFSKPTVALEFTIS
jgi:hypothetical protein